MSWTTSICPLGKLRIREQGSAGTHNGLRSIVGEMGTQKFARLRVGIGEPSGGAIGHVLTRFNTDEKKIVDEVLNAAADAVEDWALRRSQSRRDALEFLVAGGAGRVDQPQQGRRSRELELDHRARLRRFDHRAHDHRLAQVAAP